MSKSITELKSELLKLKNKAEKIEPTAEAVTEACFKIGKSWSGSSLVGHAKFFYGNFEEPATTERFSIEWGLINGVPEGWSERSDEEVRSKIEEESGASLDKLKDTAIELENEFQDIQREIVLSLSNEGFTQIEKIEKFAPKSTTDYFNELFPTSFMTRDTEAMTGHYVVSHIYYDSVARYISKLPNELKDFLFEIDKTLSTKPLKKVSETGGVENETYYIESPIILSLSQITSDKFDLTRLIEMCKELNDNYSLKNYLATGMLIRAILDHIPPIFGKTTFAEVSNNYGNKSFKDIVLPLETSSRKISDAYLHTTIRNKEILPNKTQVSFQPNMDFLLSEVIRILKK